jgi:AcrR family transcriptional regulator
MLQSRRRPDAAKRDALLEAAALEFNAYGIAGASLARIARSIGATRPALYYYVEDREDLAAQCYRRTCETMADDLAAAARTTGSGLERLLAFVRRALDPGRVPTAVLSEIDYLGGRTRDAIAKAHGGNVEALRGIVRNGIADKSLRPCDDEVIAQVVIGIIFWVPLAADWVEGTGSDFRRRTADALLDFLMYGQAANRDLVFRPSVSIRDFFPRSASAFDRKATALAKSEELMMTASQLFNQSGIDGTSLDDITLALGATKGALYHYFRDKGDLVVRCYRRAFTLYERFVEAAEAHPGSALERGLIGLYLNVQAQTSGLSPLVQLAGVAALPAPARREITHRASKLQQWYSANGRAGIADGSNRNIDFNTAAQFGAGSFEWLPKWLKPGDPRRESAIAEEIMAVFARGLARR